MVAICFELQFDLPADWRWIKFRSEKRHRESPYARRIEPQLRGQTAALSLLPAPLGIDARFPVMFDYKLDEKRRRAGRKRLAANDDARSGNRASRDELLGK